MGEFFFFSFPVWMPNAKVNFKSRNQRSEKNFFFHKRFLAANTRKCNLWRVNSSKDRRATLEEDQKWHNGQNSFLSHSWYFMTQGDSDN